MFGWPERVASWHHIVPLKLDTRPKGSCSELDDEGEALAVVQTRIVCLGLQRDSTLNDHRSLAL